MTMLKILVAIIALAILSQSIPSIECEEVDEFAEFEDDFGPTITEQIPTVTNDRRTTIKERQSNLAGEELADPVSSSDGPKSPNRGAKVEDELTANGEDESRQKKPNLKLVNAPSLKQFRIESYYIEILFLIVSLLYLVNFFVGSAKNQKFAQEWYEQSKDLLKQQFVVVGGAPTISEGPQKRDEETESYLASLKKQRGLIKASESLFTIWNSGRVGLEGLLVEINLLKRQDLFSMALTLLKASKDNLTLRFALSQDGYENFVFCIAHRTQAAKLVRDMVDINTFCPKRKPLSQHGIDSEKLLVMSELSDVASFILDQKTADFLKKYERSINYIHITDHYSSDRSEDISPMQKLAHIKRIATFSFSFPKNAEERSEFILFSLSLLDRLRRFKLARDSKQKSEKNRQKITEYIQKAAFTLRQEAVQAKKEEMRRLEKERIYNEEDPEKQRRWERKEAKREQKKSKLRVKQLRVKSM
jgi:hypothetical protein